MNSRASFYSEQISIYLKETRKWSTVLQQLSMARFLSFILFGALLYWGFTTDRLALKLFSLPALLLFIYFVRRALKAKEAKQLAEKLLWLNEYEQSQLAFAFSAGGKVFSLPEIDQATDDLDLLGEVSLYRLISRCTTTHGRQELRRRLQKPENDGKRIILLQQAVQQLSDQTAVRQQMIAQGLIYGEKEGTLEEVLAWTKESPVLLGKSWLWAARYLLPLVNLILLGNYLLYDRLTPFLLAFSVSWLIIGSFARHTNRQHLALGKKQDILQQYASILKLFGKMKFGESVYLADLHEKSNQADTAIRKLSQLSSFFDQRLNMLVNLFLNSIFLYDVHCLLALEKWREEHRKHFEQWIHLVGDIETMNSLANFAFNHEEYVYPVLWPNELLGFEARQMQHPLIPPASCVPNDFTLGGESRVVLITGSNMSGKTTFLRTVGVNMVLAQNGSPVAARHMQFSPMKVLSSIRVSDSLQEHTSYFMAELKQLQHIVHELSAGAACLVLMDEILRGTNSDDKTHGSASFIRKLLQYHCLTLFATHDLVLSSLENDLPGQVGNYCFESEISGNDLHFDYKLRKGVARNRNASFLMKKMDII